MDDAGSGLTIQIGDDEVQEGGASATAADIAEEVSSPGDEVALAKVSDETDGVEVGLGEGSTGKELSIEPGGAEEEPAVECMPKYAELTLIDWLGEFSSLAEDLLGIFLFDEDSFPTITIFLVFMLEPMADNLFKFAMKCTETEWDDFAYDVFSEALQCFLYIHFSSYSSAACLWFPIFCAFQIILLCVQKALDLKAAPAASSGGNEDEEQGTELMLGGMQCCMGNCMILSSSISPLFLTLYQDNAPFRALSFDIVLTLFYWTQGLSLTIQMVWMTEMMHGEISMKNGPLEQQPAAFQQMARLVDYLKKCSVAFNVYFYVLCWIYWFSGDIEEDFDRGYTLYMIIVFSTMGCCTLLQGMKARADPNSDTPSMIK